MFVCNHSIAAAGARRRTEPVFPQEMVRVLEEPGSRAGVRLVVSHLTALGVEGGHICRLIASLGGVRGLLDVCLEPRLRQCRSDALRALATVCCVAEGILELDKV